MNSVSKGKRLGGILIDGIIALMPYCFFALLGKMLNAPFLNTIGWLVFVAAYLCRDAMFLAQSIGKKIMKYQVVKKDGSYLTGDYKTSALRNISLFIPLVDAVLVLINKPRLGDRWAHTKLIDMA